MEFNWSILGWIAGLIFVYAFGLFEGRNQGYKKRKAEEAQEKKEHPAPAATAPETITVDEPGLLRIKDENGSYVLDLDGRRVKPALLSPDQRRRLIDMLNIMRPWLEGRSASAEAGAAAPASAARPTVPPPPVTTPTSLEERLQAIGSPPPASRPAPVPPASPPRPASGASTIAKDDRPSAPANSIVSQIDAVLQERLAGTPLEERGIFLTQSPDGSVNVYVGLTRYNGIDDVPDPAIKSAIRAAIAEWENKYTPGF